ncbi:hemerythrin domain-containing protein [Putridiphycobacter roseus]|uniref:Hemerythrin domain-containing protein n=1 Tax=Putridiphycobacter roseus TaxID=2219161 RepID=A0A2W1N404_9FLAO|nr:hemerythrin domain-containing protein [Putridiphycobacter roseus]PZE17781.1 hemerythrin domain-containing protein [Putridiphycobacter roseus]
MKNTSIFNTLRKDHDIQRDLVSKLVETTGESEERKLIFNKLKHELAIHANAEERFFYKPLIAADLTQEKARHGIAEHHEMDELIEKMDSTEMSSAHWLKLAKDLAHEVKHHLKEEEHEIFQLAGKVLTENKKEDLGIAYLDYINANRVA